MEPYIFISYSSHDKTVADAICHYLEDNSILCWIAPRDILPGNTWAGSIIKAIRNCSAMLLIYSKNSNESGQVANEVDKAFSNGKTIIPFMMDQTPLNDDFDYYLSRKHWLVAYPDYRTRFADLLKAVSKVVPPCNQQVPTDEPSKAVAVSEAAPIAEQEVAIEPAVEKVEATEKAITPEPIEAEVTEETADVMEPSVEEEEATEAFQTTEPIVEEFEEEEVSDAMEPSVEEEEPTEATQIPESVVEEEETKEEFEAIEPAVENDDVAEGVQTPESIEEEGTEENSDTMESSVEEDEVTEDSLTLEPTLAKEETKKWYNAWLPTVEEYDATESVKTSVSKVEEEETEEVSDDIKSWVEEDDAAEATETAGTVDADVESDMEEDSSEELSDSQLEIFHPVWSDDVTDDQRRVIQGILCNMVKVEGGQLELGATKEQLKWAKKKEMPAHMVELSPFWICKFPVTQGEWEAVIDGNDYLYKGSKIPQSKVSLVDCRKFVEQLRKLTGIAFALPTEAQWEFAARGGIHSKGFVYAGSDDLKEVGWCYSSCLGSPRNVGLLKPNELGLYDMSGNVFEWCDEMYGEYTSEYVKDPHNVYTKVGFWSSNHFVLRGGGAVSSKKACRISYRGEHMSADYQGLDYGLRLVVSTTSESETVSPEHNEAESLDVSGIVPNELESSAIPENESVSSDYNESDSSEDSVAVTAELELYEASFSESVSPERSEADSSEDSVIVPNESESTSASVGEAVSHASESEKFHPIWSEEVTEDQRRVILGILSNMVKVEGGQLELGATKEQLKWAKKKEMPAHMVELSSFWICKFPVTEGEWKTVINGNDSLSKRSKIPKNNLTLLACRKFVKRLRQLTGIDFTLPTEAQWEFAARGGIHSKGFVYAGSDNLLEVGWCYNSFKSGRQEVGLLKPNELGLYDMSGNVFEWCDEIFGEYTPDFVKDPHNHYTKSGFWNSGHYVLRGGDNLSNKKCRVSYREVTHADTYATRTYGLRLVINSVIPQKNV